MSWIHNLSSKFTEIFNDAHFVHFTFGLGCIDSPCVCVSICVCVFVFFLSRLSCRVCIHLSEHIHVLCALANTVIVRVWNAIFQCIQEVLEQCCSATNIYTFDSCARIKSIQYLLQLASVQNPAFVRIAKSWKFLHENLRIWERERLPSCYIDFLSFISISRQPATSKYNKDTFT